MNIRHMIAGFLFLGSVFLQPAISNAQEIIIPDCPVMKLDEIGIYSVGYQYRDKAPQSFPDGWSGMFEAQTGVSCIPFGRRADKDAFLLHCPWRNGVGIAYQEFLFQIPHVKEAYLSGFTAMADDGAAKSDGVVFRIYVNGEKCLDVYQKDTEWKPFRIDLNKYIGRTVRIRFETDPGPNDDASYDFSIWGDRELHLVGYTPRETPKVPPPPVSLSRLLSSSNNSVVPLSGYDGNTISSLSSDGATFQYSGPDGLLKYTWKFPVDEADPPLGSITLTCKGKDAPSFGKVAVATPGLQWASPAVPGRSTSQKTDDGSIVFTRVFEVAGVNATLTVKGHMQGKSLVLDVQCDTPKLTVVSGGVWANAFRQKQVVVPYYSGRVSYLSKEDLFVNAFLDWTSSFATRHDGNDAVYLPLTDGTYNPAQETIIYTAAWHLNEVIPNIPNPKSPYQKTVGNRIVLDIWGGRFVDIAQKLRELHDYGITNCIAIIHDWQRSGYDNALPMHVPANPALGGDEGMKVLTDTARELGYLIALHENYVDYYPNYDFYDENDIALDSNGNKQLAWYNEGTKIQSFAIKPNAILRLASTQSPEIHRRYGTNADYLDVHSAVPPFFHVDQRAGEEGAGMLKQTWKVHRQLWEYERQVHGGPVFGEGNAHWYWSGLLDGVEAQFGIGWPANEGMSAPLMVDFDLLKMHPLQENHGMGYYERWWKSPTNWAALPPMVVMDQYRMQEIAYGHNGFLSKDLWSNILYAWLEHNLVTPVSSRYAEAVPVSIEYKIGEKWVDPTEAAKSGAWDRVRIRYDNGLKVVANNAKEALKEGDYTLPQYGWLVEGAGVTAYTAIRNGAVVDYAETDDSVFANARDMAVWNTMGIKFIRPEVIDFKQTAPRTISFTYNWHVNDKLDGDYVCFVHFCGFGQGSRIAFQQDHEPLVATSQWRRGDAVTDGPYTLSIPDNIADGDYDWYIGLVDINSGSRIPLDGVDDGYRRIHLGVLHISNNGSTITFTPEKPAGTERTELYRRDLNPTGATIDFGLVQTNGSVMIKRIGNDWVMQTMPRDKDFVVKLNSKKFGKPSTIKCEGGTDISPSDAGDGWWGIKINGSPAYRWKAN